MPTSDAPAQFTTTAEEARWGRIDSTSAERRGSPEQVTIRRDESTRSARSEPTRARNSVGVPWSVVIRSASTQSFSAEAPTRRGSMATRVAPEARAKAATVNPAAKAGGRARPTRSPGPIPRTSSAPQVSPSMVAFRHRTPFGRPVEPDVNRRATTSSRRPPAGGRSGNAAGSRGPSSAGRSIHVSVPSSSDGTTKVGGRRPSEGPASSSIPWVRPGAVSGSTGRTGCPDRRTAISPTAMAGASSVMSATGDSPDPIASVMPVANLVANWSTWA